MEKRQRDLEEERKRIVAEKERSEAENKQIQTIKERFKDTPANVAIVEQIMVKILPPEQVILIGQICEGNIAL